MRISRSRTNRASSAKFPVDHQRQFEDGDAGLMFDLSKEEQFGPYRGFKTLLKRLRVRCTSNKEDIITESLEGSPVFVISCPKQPFSAEEFEVLSKYIMEKGRSVLVMSAEGGDVVAKTNLNEFLENFGITINNDVVVRTQFYKYFHPKECFVSNGVLNRGLLKAAGVPPHINAEGEEIGPGHLDFVYPYGATLNVHKPAVPVLSSGSVSYPMNRPVCAFYEHRGGGKLAVVGSPHIFTDGFIEKEDNYKIFEVVYKFLTTNDVQLNTHDVEDPDIIDYNYIPDSKMLSDQLKVCLQEGEELSPNYKEWFDQRLFVFDIDVLPKVIDGYRELGVKHRPLGLIKPNFEAPMPPLRPAVYPPQFRDLPAPGLDLYDLDEQFASEKVRLAQLCNKCTDDDLEYFLRECGEILGVSAKMSKENRDGKRVLGHVLEQIVRLKKID